MLVIPATQETEAGELLEPARQRLQWAKIVPLHSSLSDRMRLHLKKEKKKKKQEGEKWVGAQGFLKTLSLKNNIGPDLVMF